MDLKKELLELLAYFQNEETGIEVRGDREGIGIYFTDSERLSVINKVAKILEELLEIEEHELTVHRDPDMEKVILVWVWTDDNLRRRLK